jgi:lysozyme-like protein
VARRSASDIYRDLRAAGFSPPSATIGTAVALASSGGDDTAVGAATADGSPYGLWQIRALPGDTGQGTARDIASLSGDDAAQARAAYAISRGGLSWAPWAVFNSGAYRAYLGQAQAAAASSGDSSNPGQSPDSGGLGGAITGGLIGGVGTAALGAGAAALNPAGVLAGVRSIAIEALVLGLGVGLLALGIWRFAGPSVKAAGKKAATAAAAAATL